MAKKAFERQLDALEDLRKQLPSPAAVDALRKALANPNNYIVSKAARIAGDAGLKMLIPELLAAWERFFENPSESDPQCWAKNAIVIALAGLEHHDSAVYLRGLRHVQPEAVWGGQQDTAGPLRAKCALALVQCRDINDTVLLSHLLEFLLDRDKTVRVDVARAIGRIDREEAALLLRLRALMDDEEPEVLGACFSSILSIEGAGGIEFVGRFLERDEETAGEAALALGLMRDRRAFLMLKQRWDRPRDSTFSTVLLTAMALTRQTEAIEFLLHLVETGDRAARSALKVIAGAGLPEEVRARVAHAVKTTGNPQLEAAYQEHFERQKD